MWLGRSSKRFRESLTAPHFSEWLVNLELVPTALAGLEYGLEYGLRLILHVDICA